MQTDIDLDEYSGRNYEIIHICEEKCPFTNAIDYAISTHQNDLVNYFLDNYEDKIEPDSYMDLIDDEENPYKMLNSQSIRAAVRSLNYEIIVPCLKKIVFIVKSIEMSDNLLIKIHFENKRTIFEDSAFDMELFKFLYNLNAKVNNNISLMQLSFC